MRIKQSSAGLTLIELVIAITIISILAAVGIPRFANMISKAQIAATTAVASALSAANANNYATRSVSAAYGVAITNCSDVPNTLQNTLPAGYSITSNAATVDTSVSCTLTGPDSTSATFTATGIS